MSSDTKTLTWIYVIIVISTYTGISIGLWDSRLPHIVVAVLGVAVAWAVIRIARRDLPKGMR